MSNAAKNTHHGSFSHAFLPGLILGLVIGAVAGAFLPDFLGGNKIPPPTGDSVPGEVRTQDGEAPLTDDQIQDMIDDAQGAAGDLIDDAGEAAEDLIDDAKEALPTGSPAGG